jgi:vacuolar protein sorting-associated protein 54
VSKLKNLLEVETWTQAEVASEFFFIFKCLMDTEEGLYKQHSNELPGMSPRVLPVVDLSSHVCVPAGKNLKALEIVGEKYLVVNTLLFFGEILHDYLVCVDTLPVLAVDVIFRLAEILTVRCCMLIDIAMLPNARPLLPTQLFNRRTCELVLGKEAVSFGLIKTITASHLAMASQCLSLLITLVPNLSERLRGYLKDEKQHAFLGEIETVLMDYIEHRQQIFQKFVRMMSDRVDDCTKVYKPDESSTKPSAAFETLAKKTQMLHKILRPILPPSQFKTIFRQVFSEYMDKLKAFFARLSPRNVKEKQRISNDVVFLLLKLRELEGVDDPGEELLAYVQTLYK